MIRILTAAFAALLMVHAGAATADQVTDKLAARLAKLFPKDHISAITPAPLPGLYEVMIGASLFYVSADGRYVLHGDVIDIENKVNISDQRRALARKQVLADLPADRYIEFPATGGKARRTLYVFTDIDCGYCRKMHGEVGKLNAGGVAVRYLAFPRTGLKGESFKKAAAVWCAADRQQAITQAKLGKRIDSPECDSPVAEEFELGNAMGVTGTPAVYTEEGKHIGGYLPAEQLIRMVDDGKL